MDEREKESRALLDAQLKGLGVSLEEMENHMAPKPEQDAATMGGGVKPVTESKTPAEPPKEPPKNEAAAQPPTPPVQEDLAAITDESLDEAFKFVRKKVGAKVRRLARKAKKYYRKMKAKMKKQAKRWKKSAAGKRFLKKYKLLKKRLGTQMQKYQGKKRLQIAAGMELSAKLQEAVGSQPVANDLTDIDILETGAVIAAMLGDNLEDLELSTDAEAARQTSDGIIAIIEKYEGKGAVPDEEMTRAVKAIGVCIDHFEKLEGDSLPLPA